MIKSKYKVIVYIGEGVEKFQPLIEGQLSPNQQEKWVNEEDNNHLLFCTHSPYILNALTLAIKAKGVKNQNIVPIESCISMEYVRILETRGGGYRELAIVNGLPSDDNYLNTRLAKSNELFDNLLELEENEV